MQVLQEVAARGGRLVIVCGRDTTTVEASTDGGSTWSAPTTVATGLSLGFPSSPSPAVVPTAAGIAVALGTRFGVTDPGVTPVFDAIAPPAQTVTAPADGRDSSLVAAPDGTLVQVFSNGANGADPASYLKVGLVPGPAVKVSTGSPPRPHPDPGTTIQIAATNGGVGLLSRRTAGAGTTVRSRLLFWPVEVAGSAIGAPVIVARSAQGERIGATFLTAGPKGYLAVWADTGCKAILARSSKDGVTWKPVRRLATTKRVVELLVASVHPVTGATGRAVWVEGRRLLAAAASPTAGTLQKPGPRCAPTAA